LEGKKKNNPPQQQKKPKQTQKKFVEAEARGFFHEVHPRVLKKPAAEAGKPLSI